MPYWMATIAGVFALLFGFTASSITGTIWGLVVLGLLGSSLLVLQPRISLYCISVYLAFEGVLKIFSNYHPVVHVGIDLLILILMFKAILEIVSVRSGAGFYTPVSALVLIHFVWFCITMFNPNSLGLVPSLAGGKMYVTVVLVLFLSFRYIETREHIRQMMYLWCAVTALQVIASIYQGSIGPESVTSLHPRYAMILERYRDGAFRPFGLSFAPGAPAVFVFLTMPFFMYFLTISRKLWVRIAISAYLPMAIFTLILCQVRSAIIKSIIGAVLTLVGVLMVRKNADSLSSERGPQFLGVFAVLAVIFFYLPDGLEVMRSQVGDAEKAITRSMTTFNPEIMSKARAGGMDRFLSYIQTVPLGAGIGRTGAAGGKFAELQKANPLFLSSFFSDNYWIAVLVDLGFPGLVLFSILIFTVFGYSAQSALTLKDAELRFMAIAITSSMLAIIFGMIGTDAIIYNPEGFFFWSFAGIVFRIRVLDAEAVVKA